jgi:hypothetical protein
MFITVHATAGVIIGQHIQNPFLSFLLAFCSHFILDMLPHGDTEWFENYRERKKMKMMASVVLTDVCTAFVFLFSLYPFQIQNPPPSMITGLVGGILPDILVGLYELTKKYFLTFRNFHTKIHNFIKFDFSFKYGFIFQIIILIILISAL